jgi:hypothetical protein
MAHAWALEAIGRAPLQTRESGRVCETEGCRTLLSIYNPSRMCWIHHRFDDLRGGPYSGRASRVRV